MENMPMKYKTSLTLIISLISIALLASLTLNFYLFNQARQYYLQLNQTRLDPLGLNNYPLEANSQLFTNSDKISVVFFGDSRAASWPSPSSLSRFNFINRGIGAQTSR